MIKVIARMGDDKATLFLGLERENTDRLHADLPIVIDVQELLAETSGVTRIDRIALIAGENLEDVYRQLRAGGLPLPEQMPDFMDGD